MEKIKIMLLFSSMRKSKVILGAGRVILSLVKGLDRDKFQVITVLLIDGRVDRISLLERLKELGVETVLIHLKGRFDITSIFKLRRIIKKYDIDILHCHAYKSDIIGFLASAFIKVKRITTIHGWTKADLKVRFYEYLDAFIIRFYDKIIAVSKQIKKQLIRKRIPEDKICVVHNSINVKGLSILESREKIRREFNIPDGYKIVGTVGRMSKEKGHDYFLKAAARVKKEIPNVIFVIVGDGPMRNKLKKLTAQLKIKDSVIFTGYREGALSIMNDFDLFVLSSLREGLPMVILEAMAHRKPVISFDIGGVPEVVIDGQTGILTPPKDFKALAENIISLLNNPNKAKRLGEVGLKKVTDDFNVEDMVRNYEKTYEQILTESNHIV